MPEHIKINDLPPRCAYTSDGAATTYPVPFPFMRDEDIRVWIGGVSAERGIDFTLSGAGDSNGGTAVLPAPLPSGTPITVLRASAIERLTDFLPGSALQANTLNAALDQSVLVKQELSARLDRTLRPADHDQSSVPGPLPSATARSGRLLAFDASGDPTAGPETAIISSLSSDADNAAASAMAAHASAVTAASAAADVAYVSALVQNIPVVSTGTGDGAETDFTLSAAPVDKTALIVTLNGIVQHAATYSVTGTTLSFDAAPPTGVAVEVRDLSSTAIVDATEVSTLAALASELAALAAIEGDISTAAANTSDISDVADDLNGANTIGAAVTAATNAANSATSAASAAAAAGTAQTAAETAQAASETAQAAAETAQAAAESAETGAEMAKTAAETARSGAETARDVSSAMATAAASSATDAGTAETNAAASAASAASAAAAAAVRAEAAASLRARTGLRPALFMSPAHGDLSLITFSRATVAYRVTAEGAVESIAIDTPRLTYDPGSGACLGLYMERATTYNWKQNQDVSAINTPWSFARQRIDLGLDAGTAPDGTSTADKLIPTVDDDTHALQFWDSPEFSVADGAEPPYALMVKSAGINRFRWDMTGVGTDAQMSVDLRAGGSVSVTNGGAAGLIPFGDDWWLTFISDLTTSAGIVNPVLRLQDDAGSLSFAGDGTSGLLVSTAIQHSDGKFPASFMPTASATVTRAADLASIDLTAQSGWRPEAYSLLIIADLRSEDGVLAEIGQSGIAEMTLEMQGGALHLTGAGGLDLTLASGLTYGDRVTAAARMQSGNIAGACNGGAVVAAADSITMAKDSEDMQLGSDLAGANGLNCIISDVALFGILSDTKLQEISDA